MLGNQPTVIGRLRVRAGAQDSLLTQMRIGRLLDPIELRPTRLPSSAILCIRKLRDPLPGSLRLDQSNVRPPPAWQEALSETLDRLASRALRPAREAVPPGAEAVVFLDRSELLACLASDWCEGSVTTRWWWQSLLKQGAATQIVKDLWRRDPQYVPAALQQLANKNKAADFVRALSDTEARQLLRGVAQSFALPALIRVLDDFETPPSTGRNSLDLIRPQTAVRQMNDPVITAAGPWRRWVPECRAAGLRPDQEFFFGMALMLRRAPIKAHAPEFHATVREWKQSISLALASQFVRANLDGQLVQSFAGQSSGIARARSEAREVTSSSQVASKEPIGVRSATPASAAERSIDVVKADQIGLQPLHAQQQSNEELARPSPARAKVQPATTTRTDRITSDSMEQEIGSPPSSLSREPPSAQSEASDVTSDADRSASDDVLLSPYDESQRNLSATVTAENEQDEEWVETHLGGVFYLINLGLSLGFYGDFTTPDEPGIQLNIWDFVALLARELVGDDVVNDPVWRLFRELTQREEGDLLGAGFDPEAVSSLEFQVSSYESSEVSTVEAGEQRNQELELQDSEPETRNSKLETYPATAAWVDRLMPYVRARLRLALGLSEVDDPGPIVCCHRARVCLTPTHLDVFFYLADLPIEVRIAGLDRNPGWVPAAGRFIAFHFE